MEVSIIESIITLICFSIIKYILTLVKKQNKTKQKQENKQINKKQNKIKTTVYLFIHSSDFIFIIIENTQISYKHTKTNYGGA